MITACTTKPAPMVTVLRISRMTTARLNNNTRPAQVNSTMSRFGVRSLTPVISAINVGMVAQCNVRAVSHCSVSADTRGNCVLSHVVMQLKILLSWVIIFCFLSKRYGVQSWPPWVCPIADSHSLRENTKLWSNWAVEIPQTTPAWPLLRFRAI